MSFRIYEAYKIKANNLDDAYQKVNTLKEPCAKKANKIFMDFILSQTYRKHCLMTWPDLGQMNGAKYKTSDSRLIRDVFHSIEKDFIENPEHAHPQTEAHVVIIPHRKEYFLLIYCQNKQMEKIISKSPFLEEFGYWDNTDEPKNVDPKEWKRRGKIWGEIFKNNETPVDVGVDVLLSKNLGRSYFPIEDLRKAKYNPSEENKKFIKNEYLIDVLLHLCDNEPKIKTLKKKDYFSLYGIAEKVISDCLEHIGLYQKEAELILPYWNTLKEQVNHFNFSYPTLQDLFCSNEELRIKKENNTLLFKNQKQNSFKIPKI